MPPLSGPRAVQVTRTLLALGSLGWESQVVCFGPTSTRYQQDFRIDVEAASAGRVRRFPVASPEEWLLFRALWRIAPPLKHLPDEKRVWKSRALAEARRLIATRRPDVLVSFAQPWTDHLIALELHRESGIPWVAHFSDPWVDSPYHTGRRWQRRRWEQMEADVIDAATRIVFVNAYSRDRVMAKYPAAWASRADVVPQGFDPAALIDRNSSRLSSPRLRIVYTGRFYHGIRSPEVFLQALAKLNAIEPLHGRLEVEFVGQDMNRYENLAGSLGLGEVARFTGRLDLDQTRRLAAHADVLLTIDAPSDGPSLFLPSKLIDYLPFERPILALTPLAGPSADLIRELQYAVVDPADVDGTAAAVTALIDRHAAGRLGASAVHRSVAQRYTIHATTEAFSRVLEQAVSSSR